MTTACPGGRLLPSPGGGRGSGRPGWFPARGTRAALAQSREPGARWRGGARWSPPESARHRPRARRRRGLRGAARELSLVLTSRPLGTRLRDAPRASGSRPPPLPRGAPAALCLLPSLPLHSAGVWCHAKAEAAYPQRDLGARPSPGKFLVLVFQTDHSTTRSEDSRRRPLPGTQGLTAASWLRSPPPPSRHAAAERAELGVTRDTLGEGSRPFRGAQSPGRGPIPRSYREADLGWVPGGPWAQRGDPCPADTQEAAAATGTLGRERSGMRKL